MPARKNKKKAPAKSRKPVRQKSAPNKSAAKKKALFKKTAPKKKAASKKKRVRGRSEDVNTVTFEPKGLGARSGGQSGDLQGLSDIGGADSESVGELLEEGNAFEAELVKGVEDVPDADAEEVKTREVPEEDVPEEYLEEEQ